MFTELIRVNPCVIESPRIRFRKCCQHFANPCTWPMAVFIIDRRALISILCPCSQSLHREDCVTQTETQAPGPLRFYDWEPDDDVTPGTMVCALGQVGG